jgi:hypothetical protein
VGRSWHGRPCDGQAFAELSSAKEAAKGLLAKMQAEKKKKEAAWEKKCQTLKVTRKEDRVAYIAAKDKGEDVRIPLDDESWKDIVARDAKVYITWGRAAIRDDGKSSLLSHWLLNEPVHQVVDHVNLDRFDHRLTNLRIVDRSANGQNVTRSEGGYIGVKFHRTSWRVYVDIKGKYRAACKLFPESELDQALELHDLTALHQHGAGAPFNFPKRQDDYLKMLDRFDPGSFLTGRRGTMTPYKHAYRHRGGYRGAIKRRSRDFQGTGTEARAAIFAPHKQNGLRNLSDSL